MKLLRKFTNVLFFLFYITPVYGSTNTTGSHSFDFLIGKWSVHHRYLRIQGDHREWLEVAGTCSNHQLMDGLANIDECTISAPSGAYQAIGLRSFDVNTKQWAIWWLDGRYPSGPIDPPVTGKFEDGIGKFYSDYIDNGKPMRVRFLWSKMTPTSARWEQSTSDDDGKTWKPNWIMEFQRVS
ncbi:DUF1579 domain-containing protein [bacterium]|nr:DUF1579 domain-containing protein [bacterium]